MATTSYGKITIIDVTDVGNFSVYPYANGPNTQIYSEENSTYYPNWATGSHLVLTPVVTYAGQDKTAESTVNWYLKTDLEHPITNGFNAVTKQLTISTNIPTANTYIVYVVKAHYVSETGAEVDAEGEITFSLLTQPSSIKNVSISGTNVIKYSSDSNVPNPSTVTLTATLTGGTNITGDGWKYWNGSAWKPDGNSYITTGNPSGLTVNNTQLTVTASYDNSAIYFNADTARFKYMAHATADSTDVYEDIFTVFQLRDGASGDKLVTMDLTNDDQLVPIDKEGNAQWDSIGDLAGTTVRILEGSSDITSTAKVVNLKATLTNVTVELYNGSTKYIGTWNSGSNLPTGYYTVKVTGFTNNATTGSVRFDATVDSINYNKTFSLVGQIAGVDGRTPTIYTLEFPSIPALVNNPTGDAASGTLVDNWSYSPANLSIKAYKITTDSNGISTRNAYVEDVNGVLTGARVWYKPNIINGSPASGSSEWGSLDLNTSGEGVLAASSKLLADYSPYIFRLVPPSASNIAANIKDEESINIVSDGNIGNAGNAGKDSINLLINNENVTLNATSGGKTRSATITVGYQGYKGATEDSHFALATSSSYSSSKTGLVSSVDDNGAHNAVTITLNSNVTVVKGETGTITLNFVYSGGNTPITISKIISWDAKLDAIDGSPAITLTFEYDGATYFKNETGTTKVTPILLENAVNILSNSATVTWTDLIDNTKTVDIDTDGITAIIDASDISGVGSYSCTVSQDGKSYTQYVSFTDYSDPLQVELISTVGDKLTNGVGEGVVYPQTTRDGIVLDQVSSNSIVVWSHSTAPTSSDGAEGDFWFNTSNNTLYRRGASSWSTDSSYAQIFVLKTGNVNPIELRTLSSSTYPAPTADKFSNLQYIWSFRDREGNVLNPQSDIEDLKISYINPSTGPTITTTNVTGGQFMYINKSVVDNKITILCQVTKN